MVYIGLELNLETFHF